MNDRSKKESTNLSQLYHIKKTIRWEHRGCYSATSYNVIQADLCHKIFGLLGLVRNVKLYCIDKSRSLIQYTICNGVSMFKT